MRDDPNGAYLTTAEVADLYGVAERTVQNWRTLGMPFIKIGRSIRFDRAQVMDWAEKHSRGVAIEPALKRPPKKSTGRRERR